MGGRRLLKGLRYVPRMIVTDKLASYQVAHRELMPSVRHRRSKYLNNRAENSHQPTRPDAGRTPGALVHALRHTYATELANTNISVYELMKLLGHESMATSQRYVSAAGTETRAAAAQNPLYDLIALQNSDQTGRSDKRRVTARSPVHGTAPR